MTDFSDLIKRTVLSVAECRPRGWRGAGVRAIVALGLLAGSALMADSGAMASRADRATADSCRLAMRNYCTEHAEASAGSKSVEVLRGVTRIGSQVFYASNAKIDTKGRMSAVVEAYDYRILYNIYGLSPADDMETWIAHYRKDADKARVGRAAEGARKMPVKAELKFRLAGEASGSTLVYFGYETIRVKVKGTAKDFVIVNAASAVALTADGTKYRGTFEVG